MKTLNTQWKLIALGTFAVTVTIWAGSRMEAKTGQDYTAQSARVSPQVREAANEAGIGPLGLTRGQTLRIEWDIDLLNPPGANQDRFELTVFDRGGNVLAQGAFAGNTPNMIHTFDLNADQLPQQEFDNAGRAEAFAALRPDGSPHSARFYFATAQVFDNATGKSTFALNYQTGGHNGDSN